MGKRKVTYAIGFAQSTPHALDIARRRTLIKDLFQEGKHFAAARTCLDLVDLLLADADLIDLDDGHEKQLEERLHEALKYCQYAYEYFASKQDCINDLSRSLDLMVQCYHRLADFDEAIEKSKERIALLSDSDDLLDLQKAFKALADIYFQRGHDPELCKHSDFENARMYYWQERSILDKMPVDLEDEDVLAQMKRSSDFNLGVMEAKSEAGWETGETLLVAAVKQAREQHDYDNERLAWWELANVFKRQGNLERLLTCQNKELHLIRKYRMKDQEIPCLTEMIKTYLEIEDYDRCLELCREIRGLVDEEDKDNPATAVLNMVVSIKSKQQAIADMPQSSELSTVHQRASLYLQLGKQLYEFGLTRKALAAVDTALENMDADTQVQRQSSELRIQLCQLKADILWEQREAAMDAMVLLNNSIISDVKSLWTEGPERTEHLGRVYKRLANIYYFFDKQEEFEHWDNLANEIKGGSQGHPMDIDFSQIEHNDPSLETTEQVVRQVGDMDLAPEQEQQQQQQHTETEPKEPMARVSIEIEGQRMMIQVPVAEQSSTIEWLAQQTSRQIWEMHGVEPIIKEMRTDAGTVSWGELVMDVINTTNERWLVAVVEGLREKTRLELIRNGFARIGFSIPSMAENILKESKPNELLLSGLGLTSRHVPILCHVFKYAGVPDHLDLSSNLFYDQDIETLFKENRLPIQLDLRSNRLTANVMQVLSSELLERVYLGYNPLGPIALLQLPSLLSKSPNLRLFEAECCDLGNYIWVTLEMKEEFHASVSKVSDASRKSVMLNLLHNNFGRMMRSQWKPLLDMLVHDPGTQLQL